MWECAKCGHKSGTRRSSSHGCDHNWWDEHELARAREQKQLLAEAEMNRKLIAFNDKLLNTEDGQKKINSEEGRWWLIDNLTENKYSDEGIICRKWLDSSFGTNWLLTESGQLYLDYLRNVILRASTKFSQKKVDEFIERLKYFTHDINHAFDYQETKEYFGKDWLKTEQAENYKKTLIEDLTALSKKKGSEEDNRRGCLMIIIAIVCFIIYRCIQ